MDSASLMSIQVIPKSVKEDTGHHTLNRLHHTPYRDEVRLFSCLQHGDLKKLIYELGKIGIQNITVGQMSDNDLQQQKYMAVSFITLATRYAIQGGLSESKAYAYSDDFIRRIDTATNKRAVHASIMDGAIELTNMVSREQKDLTYSPHVRRCIAYINKNLDRKLTVSAVATQLSLSPDYLSHLFKCELGVNLSTYITTQKLTLAKTLLWEGYTAEQACYSLGFSSQSHFIALFKRQFGMTPREYTALLGTEKDE